EIGFARQHAPATELACFDAPAQVGGNLAVTDGPFSGHGDGDDEGRWRDRNRTPARRLTLRTVSRVGHLYQACIQSDGKRQVREAQERRAAKDPERRRSAPAAHRSTDCLSEAS